MQTPAIQSAPVARKTSFVEKVGAVGRKISQSVMQVKLPHRWMYKFLNLEETHLRYLEPSSPLRSLSALPWWAERATFPVTEGLGSMRRRWSTLTTVSLAFTSVLQRSTSATLGVLLQPAALNEHQTFSKSVFQGNDFQFCHPQSWLYLYCFRAIHLTSALCCVDCCHHQTHTLFEILRLWWHVR